MLSALALSGYIVPPPALLNGLQTDGQDEASIAVARLAGLPRKQAAFRAAIKTQRAKFNELVRQAERLEASAAELEELSDTVYGSEKQVAEQMVPKMEALGRNLATLKGLPQTPHSRALRRHMEEWLDNVATWLELYQNLRIMLIKLASDRRSVDEPGSPTFSDAGSATEYLRKLVAE